MNELFELAVAGRLTNHSLNDNDLRGRILFYTYPLYMLEPGGFI